MYVCMYVCSHFSCCVYLLVNVTYPNPRHRSTTPTVRKYQQSNVEAAPFVSCNDRAPPPSCLPDIAHVTLSPRSSPPFLHTATDQKLEAGTAWEQVCVTSLVPRPSHLQFLIPSSKQSKLETVRSGKEAS